MRIHTSRATALGVALLPFAAGLALLAWPGWIAWAALACALVCLAVSSVAVHRLAGDDQLVLSRHGLTELRGGRALATLGWDELQHVRTTRMSTHQIVPGKVVVELVVAPRARERVAREGAPAARPPWSWRRRAPGLYWMRTGYTLRASELGPLLEAARRRYG